MKRFLLDTNLLLLFLREDERWEILNNKFGLDGLFNYTSIVCLGELESLAVRNKWGYKRVERLNGIRSDFFPIDVNVETIIKQYGQIDAYSQGKLDGKPLGHSARNMGKNDLWIAATASVFNLTLLTSDQDFSHLDKTYLDVEIVDIQKIV
jgi:tRNA(fMet)-specific endonuclease VapC